MGDEADLNRLDVSGVTDMEFLFEGSQFTGDISNVTDISKMFNDCPIPEENKPEFKKIK